MYQRQRRLRYNRAQRKRKTQQQHWFPTIIISIRQWRKDNCERELPPMILRSVVAYVGVNGAQLKVNPSIHMSRGKQGCFLSHQQAWRYFVNHNIQRGVVLEDDARVINVSNVHKILEYLDTHRPQWNILLLGKNKRKHKGFKDYVAQVHIHRPKAFWGLFSYIINYQTCVRLLKELNVAMDLPIDVVISRMNLSNTLNVYATHDNLMKVLLIGSDTNNIV